MGRVSPAMCKEGAAFQPDSYVSVHVMSMLS